MKFKRTNSLLTVFLFGFLIMLWAPVEAGIANYVVINEIQTGMAGASNNEFIELYNPTSQDIDLSHRSIQYRGGASESFSKKNFVSGNIIYAKSFFLIANSGYEGEPLADLTHSSFSMSKDGGTIFFVSNQTRLTSGEADTIIDKVGYGKGKIFPEKDAVLNPSPGQSIKREPDGRDTDNNKNDFVIAGEENAGENVPSNNNGSSINGVYLNELMPDPKSPKSDITDEWIELYNENDFRVDLSGAILKDTVGVVHEYVIPDGVSIDSGRFAIFYSSATKITLNNTGDSVELLDKNGTLIDETPNYDKAKAGYSFALFEEGWQWTKAPTPLSENVFEDTAEENDKAAAAASKKKSKKESTSKNSAKAKSKGGKTAVKGSKDLNNVGDLSGDSGKSKIIGNKLLGQILLLFSAAAAAGYIIFRKRIYEYFEQKS